MKIFSPFSLLAAIAIALGCISCDSSKSYAQLLEEQNTSVNRFLIQHHMEPTVPADSNFLVGPDAPFYCIDDEGAVFMQILDRGSSQRPDKGARVYFRYTRYNVHNYIVGSDANVGSGNADNMAAEPAFFTYQEYTLTQSTQHGTGIQLPMNYLGYDCRVRLLIKSTAGPTADQSYVVPYLYDIQYLKQKI